MALYADKDVGLTRYVAFVPHKLRLEQQKCYGSEAWLFVAHITNPLTLMAIARDASREIMTCQSVCRYALTDRDTSGPHRGTSNLQTPLKSGVLWTRCTIHRQVIASKDLNPALQTRADPSGREVLGVRLRPLVFLGLWFRIPSEAWMQSLLSVVCVVG